MEGVSPVAFSSTAEVAAMEEGKSGLLKEPVLSDHSEPPTITHKVSLHAHP